ncbi:membrane protein insertion efficiency factor YidD [Desulfobacter hydrogenophilus]|uniref:Putative membrane protein insertion efficiency factor n=1 Tax=Desulfobacter hydrogenophilus TaxID=2291 RepID=A0A328FFW2_9BACT|nr:membrane protein insertion efficiency factor YidD [Desulfobacter hydrogenophilus]MCW8801595.1 membrane protein insertion efficiency factor YidD [Desulfobacter sp.]NDY73198.1 membrane protein insertion efficiency factor YidD [Desulfobacter hydrogenophilus]QBH12514.1 membrane protein insertion efficiency factor YidD [Desulfobacter hydrogenophilus]RAM03249.1 membrane protein insertion efficiency factor YidD [Desulfobacter hydrogenophilus]
MIRQLLSILIRFYQIFISPLLGTHCRYEPSCSHYALEAIQKYGSIKGSILAIKRILRCHPFRPGGYDPVP